MTLMDCLDRSSPMIVVVTGIVSIVTITIVGVYFLNMPHTQKIDVSSYEVFCIENVRYVSVKGMLTTKIGLDGNVEHCELEEL